jgi:hypothetical protein
VAVTPTTFKALFTEFASEGDSRVQLFIDQASRRLSESVFGDYYDDAVGFLTAHMLSRSTATAGRGFVSSETVGQLSRSYTQSGGILASGYATTSYGQEFSRLLRLVQPSPMVV